MERRNGDLALLGFGFMRLPCQAGQGDIDKKTAFAMVDRALEGGINYFDTAWMYHAGQSEIFAWEALSRHPRDSYKLATKMPLMALKTKDDVERIFNEQLKKCKTSFFDFYLLHNITEAHMKIAEHCAVYEQLKEKQRQGQIRHLGFSFHDRPPLLKKITADLDWDFAQIQLNYLDWEMQDAKQQYEILVERQIPVNIMEPIRGGSLAVLCEEAVRIFKEANPGASPASWALRFAASLPKVQVVLSGMSAMTELEDNMAVMSPLKPLTEDEYRIIEQALAAYRRAAAVPYTSCRYCMDCPSGVEIPKSLAVYNNYQLALANKHPMADFLFSMEYKILGKEQAPSNCTACGQCTERCPQGIAIPRWMETMTGLAEKLGG